MTGQIISKERDVVRNWTVLKTNNVDNLKKNDYISFSIKTKSTETKYNNGEKFKIIHISNDTKYIYIKGFLNYIKKYGDNFIGAEWCNDMPDTPVATENIGITFEHAFCGSTNIDFDGKFKYSIEKSNEISIKILELIAKVPELQKKYKHTAKKGSRYDFTEDILAKPCYLSLKSNKKNGCKVAPQVIGQPSKKKFCNHFNIDLNLDDEKIKEYIINNIKNLLSEYFKYTFDCSILYYHDEKNKLMFIKCEKYVDWKDIDINFTHINNKKNWNEGTTIKIGKTSIGEFQFHNNRDNIKFRWCFENLLDYFKDNFDITSTNNLIK